MSSTAPICLITGANRGIGLALVKELASSTPDTIVVAGVRDLSKALELKGIVESYPGRVDIVKFVAADVEGNKMMAEGIQAKYGKLDVVLGNAAVANYMGIALETPPEKMDEHFKVNVTGILILFQATYSLLKASKNPKFIPISSLAGSTGGFTDNALGYTCYGASKAALNFVTRKIHFENEWLTCFPLSPGVVKTDASMSQREMDKTGTLAGIQDSMIMSPEVGAKALLGIIENATREKDGGKFIHIDGTEALW